MFNQAPNERKNGHAHNTRKVRGYDGALTFRKTSTTPRPLEELSAMHEEVMHGAVKVLVAGGVPMCPEGARLIQEKMR